MMFTCDMACDELEDDESATVAIPRCFGCGARLGYFRGKPRKWCPDPNSRQSKCAAKEKNARAAKLRSKADNARHQRQTYRNMKTRPEAYARYLARRARLNRKRDRQKSASRPGVAAKLMKLFAEAVPERLSRSCREEMLGELALLYAEGWLMPDAAKEALRRVNRDGDFQQFKSIAVEKCSWL